MREQSTWLSAMALALLATVVTGCGDTDNPGDPGDLLLEPELFDQAYLMGKPMQPDPNEPEWQYRIPRGPADKLRGKRGDDDYEWVTFHGLLIDHSHYFLLTHDNTGSGKSEYWNPDAGGKSRWEHIESPEPVRTAYKPKGWKHIAEGPNETCYNPK